MSNKIHDYFMDTTSNILKMGGENEIKKLLRQKFEKDLDDMINRYKQLPAIMVYSGEYKDLLIEARQLYIEGFFYSCIVMSGGTAEKIAKELLRKTILFKNKNGVSILNEKTVKYLEKIEMNIVRELLIKSEIIDESLRTPFQKLAELRNNYVHGSDKEPQEDSKKAFEYLHEIVENTVSIF